MVDLFRQPIVLVPDLRLLDTPEVDRGISCGVLPSATA